MTTIIGVQQADGCVILYDKRTTGSDGRAWDTRVMPKAVQRAEYLLAAAGSGHICEYVLHAMPLPVPPWPGEDDYKFLCAQFVPQVRQSLRDIGFEWGSEDDPLQILVGLNGVLYQLDNGGTVCTGDSVYAIGSGGPYALGYMAYRGPDPAAAYMAIGAANRYDVNTGAYADSIRQKRFRNVD